MDVSSAGETWKGRPYYRDDKMPLMRPLLRTGAHAGVVSLRASRGENDLALLVAFGTECHAVGDAHVPRTGDGSEALPGTGLGRIPAQLPRLVGNGGLRGPSWIRCALLPAE